ncbi:hypothetical protein M408DRAFT_299636 [Serendipita vermifera MAFF 305830]|uniref:Uncharacterized protein n=1 Tax=Serendipita vermifera MAFF 305830 TaxID=933852 RepID=A0A0C2W5Y9_SERVB|nr:hypothetical protein M408DRAFT_299636 [Serendipita vermifera MAFF 305830]
MHSSAHRVTFTKMAIRLRDSAGAVPTLAYFTYKKYGSYSHDLYTSTLGEQRTWPLPELTSLHSEMRHSRGGRKADPHHIGLCALMNCRQQDLWVLGAHS